MTSTVLMISPGYPAEMPFFTRGLARAGARVIGAGDQSMSALPDMAREHLAACRPKDVPLAKQELPFV